MADNDSNTATSSLPRRTILKGAGALGLTSAIGGIGSAQEDGEEEEEITTIVLGGQVNNWYGIAPTAIQGEENPTLQLQEDTEYQIVWINIDGVEHELVLEDADDNTLLHSLSESGVGESESVLLNANQQMDEYYCEYHPQSMRGRVEIVESGGLGEQAASETEAGNGTDGGNTTETETETNGYSG